MWIFFSLSSPKFLRFLSFSHFLSTYLVAQLRKMFTFLFRSTLSTFSISWMHLFYYFSSNPRYEVTVRRTLRPISLKSFVNLRCMLTATSIKHRDMRLDFWVMLSARAAKRARGEKSFRERTIIVIYVGLCSVLAMCIMLRSPHKINETKSERILIWDNFMHAWLLIS